VAPLFTLRTLGVPTLLAASGEVVRFRTRKHFALLIRLAVEPSRPLTRDYLIELLWGSAPEAAGRHSLAQAVTVLKAKIGREHVAIHKSTVALTAGVVDADVNRLEQCDGDIGGRFLDAFEIPGARAFEDWRDASHARLMPQLRDCLVRHMDGARRIGDFGTVQKHAEVLAQLDPLSEDALRGIMEARAWVGDRSNALKAYAAFEARLAEELGAQPAPELARIAHLLREGRRSPYRQPSDPPPVAGEKRFEPERVVGREREFSRLYDAWISARRREPCLMVLTGDPGVGKTTLTNAFVSTCQLEGAVVARAQAYDAERELPFAVLAELVRQLTIQRAIGAADPEALSELSRICADVVAAFPGVPKPVEWSAEITPLRLADAFLKTILAAAEESPLVLVVDDIHAVDNASAAILHVVARKLPLVRLLLILTGRTSELRASGAAQALATDASIGALRSLDLEPLAPEAAERLVAVLSENHSAPLPDGVAGRILAASGGNPLAIELLVREWQAHGAASLLTDLDRLNTLPAATLGIPRAIRTVFERQVARLDRNERAALDLAAVLGRRLSDLTLYRAADLSPAEAGEALSRLCDEGLLREVHGELEFRNELIRAQAYYAVAAVARQHLHHRIAEILRSMPAETNVSIEVAWHFVRAGDHAEAVPHALQGSEAALERGAPHEVEQLLQELAAKELPPTNKRLITLAWSRALVEQSKAQTALPILERLLADPGELTLTHLAEASRLLAASEYLTNQEADNRHVAAAEAAMAIARRTGASYLVLQALFEYARSGTESGDEQRVRTAFEQLQEIEPSLESEHRAFASYALAYCEHFLFDIASAAERLSGVVDLLERNANDTLLQLVYTGLGICHFTLCALPESLTASQRAFQIASRLGNDSRASVAASNLCAAMLAVGDYPAAITWGCESVTRGERALNQPMLRNAYGNLTAAYGFAGRLDEALKAREKGIRWVTTERSWLARLHYAADDACQQFVFGNFAAGLDLTATAERLAAGRERAVPPISAYNMVKAIRMREVAGAGAALAHAAEITTTYADRVPMAFLNALCIEFWLRRSCGLPVDPSRDRAFQELLRRMPGRRILYRALGILD
jgi:DNA-binding SARP family transcriptional activator/tetratricopeptide (TPR) repeat protein